MVDGVYIVSLAWLTSNLMTELAPLMKGMQDLFSKISPTDPKASELLVANQAQLMDTYSQMMAVIGIHAILFVILWIILSGASWYLAHRICKTKLPWTQYAKQFVSVTAIGIALAGVLYLAIISVGQATSAITMVIPPEAIYFATLVMTIVVLFLTFFGYADIPHNTGIRAYLSRLGKKWKAGAIGFIVFVGSVVVTNYLMQFLIGTVWVFLVMAFVALPIYCLGRIFMIEMVK